MDKFGFGKLNKVFLVWALVGLGFPAMVQAQSLVQREVSFSILTYDDPENPLLESAVHQSVVGPGPEFGLIPEGGQNGLDVVPVMVDISENRVELDYSNTDPTLFEPAVFNGYVLNFHTDCVLFQSAQLDTEFSNFPISEDAITFDPGTLFINVAGLSVGPTNRLAIDFVVADCPMS